ncbi:MAG: hypothetical protein M3328_04155, partial [Chloroflexota bacterium]|nr:hypothetical protein [Chloroflexota bacterium]
GYSMLGKGAMQCLRPFSAIPTLNTRTKVDLVILNAVENLVLHPDVALFSWYCMAARKVLLWVLQDEILHCVQNDKEEDGRCYSYTFYSDAAICHPLPYTV